MGMLLRGAPVAAALNEKTAAMLRALYQQDAYTPTLAIVRIGMRDDDLAYERSAVRRCDALGIRSAVHTLPADCEMAALLDTLSVLNAEQTVDISGALI